MPNRKEIHMYALVLPSPLKENNCQVREIWCCSLTERKRIVQYTVKGTHVLLLKSLKFPFHGNEGAQS